MAVHLKLYDKASSLKPDGTRNWVYPADVSGRFDRLRKLTFVILGALLIALPIITVRGNPAVFLDIQHRRFYLFGGVFNAQDVWLVFFILTGVGFGLFYITTLWGRIWCGYACPQTVFLEGVFRPIERWLEGPRNERMKRDAAPWSFDKLWRKTLKHTLYVAAAFGIAHIILAYFISIPRLWDMMLNRPAEHAEAFAWAASLTTILYFNFFWFREQMCLIVCPYGRLQSVLTDDDSVLIGYDVKRGEPRGKAKASGVGDCVDCNRCVTVCPTGIDIRNGLQIDCVGCARCIDACDEVMLKLKRPTGLIRYDSLTGFAGGVRRILRPRLYFYTGLGVLGLIALSLALTVSDPFEANVIRLRGVPPMQIDGDIVRNSFEVHVVNKRSDSMTFTITGESPAPIGYVIAMPKLTLKSLANQLVPVFVTFPKGTLKEGARAKLTVTSTTGEPKLLELPLIVPGAAM